MKASSSEEDGVATLPRGDVDGPEEADPTDDAERGPPDDTQLDGPWRERVVARSLGVATRQSIDRAQALIRGAVELLESSGETFTVQDVADRAGFSLRVLYRHFASKDDLLAAVLEDQLDSGASRLRTLLGEIDDPVDRLSEFIHRTIHHEPTSLNLALAKQETLLRLTHPEEVVQAQRPMTTLGQELVQAAVDAGRIDPEVAEHGLFSMMALKRAYNHARLVGDDFGLPLPTEEEMVQHCLRALGVVPIPGSTTKS